MKKIRLLANLKTFWNPRNCLLTLPVLFGNISVSLQMDWLFWPGYCLAVFYQFGQPFLGGIMKRALARALSSFIHNEPSEPVCFVGAVDAALLEAKKTLRIRNE